VSFAAQQETAVSLWETTRVCGSDLTIAALARVNRRPSIAIYRAPAIAKRYRVLAGGTGIAHAVSVAGHRCARRKQT